MTGSFRVRSVALLLLVGTLLLPSLASAEEFRTKERRSTHHNFTALWNAFPEAWTLLKRVWEGEGSSLDPFGQPKPNGSLDPFGGR
jgi:hypothetical protein